MPNNKDNIKEKNITCNILRCNKIIGTLENTGSNNSVDLSGGVFKVTATGFLLADQSEDAPFDGTSKLIKLKDGDLVISNEDGLDEEIILDTSNQGSEITKCDHLEISPDTDADKVLFYIKDVTGNTADIVDIQTDSSTDPVFKISTVGQTTISNLVLTTADINGGTIDGTTIGASSATSGAFTTITASTSLDVTGSAGIILENDETITNSIDGTVLISGEIASGSHIFKSNGSNDVILKTGTSTTTGIITIENETNGNIAITPKGTGEVDISKVDIDSGTIDGTTIGVSSATSGAFTTITASTSLDVTGSAGIILENDETITNSIDGTVLISGEIASGSHIFKSNGSNDVILKTGTSTTTGIITIENETNGNIAITPKGTGEVDISKVDIDSGTIDGTTIGVSSATSGAFTTITASTSLDVTGSAGIILENDDTITNPASNTVLISGDVASGTHIFKSDGNNDVNLQTGNTTTGKITIANGTNGNIAITPNGTGFVNLGKISLDTEVITNISGDILNAHPDKSVLYFNLDVNSTASITNGTDGQVLHMFYGCSHNLAITFSGGLKCGSGTANTLTFNADGQSASLVFIGNSIDKWCILNTGAVIS